MLLPLLNKESTSQELSNLCWLLNEIQTSCEDLNIRWKIARLADQAEELKESFLEENLIFLLPASDHYKTFFEKVSTERTEALLSFAFNSAAVIDSANYEEFEPGAEFRSQIKSIRKETLHLLHEKRGWKDEVD